MLNYDEGPTYQQQVRQRVQQRMQPGAVGDPMATPAPPPTAGYTNPSPPQAATAPPVGGPPPGTTFGPNGAATLPGGTVLQAPAGMTRNPVTGLLTPTPGTTPPSVSSLAQNGPLAVPQGDYKSVFDQIFPGASLSPEQLAAGEGQLNRFGIKVSRNATGQATKVILPNGDVYDPIIGAGSGQNQKAWQLVGGPSFQGGAGQGPASPTGTSNPFLDSIRSMLMTRLQADQQPVDENSPQIAQPFQAASLQSQRGQEANQRALKERLYAQGDLNSGSYAQQSQQGAEQAATGLAGIKSQLIQQAYQSKVADLNEAMQQALASGDAQMAREIQMQLAALQAQIQREGLGVSLAEFGQNQNALTAHAGLNG